MIRGLRAIKLLEGIRGKEGVNLTLFNEVIRRVSALCARWTSIPCSATPSPSQQWMHV